MLSKLSGAIFWLQEVVGHEQEYELQCSKNRFGVETFGSLLTSKRSLEQILHDQAALVGGVLVEQESGLIGKKIRFW